MMYTEVFFPLQILCLTTGDFRINHCYRQIYQTEKFKMKIVFSEF